jgi:hypothetical protein
MDNTSFSEDKPRYDADEDSLTCDDNDVELADRLDEEIEDNRFEAATLGRLSEAESGLTARQDRVLECVQTLERDTQKVARASRPHLNKADTEIRR